MRGSHMEKQKAEEAQYDTSHMQEFREQPRSEKKRTGRNIRSSMRRREITLQPSQVIRAHLGS